VNLIQRLADKMLPQRPEAFHADGTPTLTLDQLNAAAYAGQTTLSPWENSIYDGGKFSGGFGATQLQNVDYWSLRNRSKQLFTENLYARGLIRRLVTNEINTGLTPESAPDEETLGLANESLQDWSETVETRFNLWAKSPHLCDWREVDTFGAIQRKIRQAALVEGDVLVVLRQKGRTRLPSLQLVSGGRVRTPYASANSVRAGHTIKHGIEFDAKLRPVAYWVQQDDGTFKRLPAFGEKSGRRLAWLVYGTDKLLDDVRGQPLLAIVLQSLKEIDRYRDSTQRKAVINSMLAMFIKKTADKPGTLPVSGGAVRRDQATVTDGSGATRNFNVTSHIPGTIMEELQTGEEPVLLGGQGTDVNFGVFEEAVIQSVAWANEMPPEILKLAFSNNYSASQAAINEFKIYLNMRWSIEGETVCGPVYVEWLVSEALLRKISAPQLLESWRNPMMYDVFAAWTQVDWYGSIKPSTDMLKQAKGSEMLVKNAWSTNAREARINTGTKFSRNVKRLKRENEQLSEALRPMLELRQEIAQVERDAPGAATAAMDDMVTEALAEYVEKMEASLGENVSDGFLAGFMEVIDNAG